MNKVKALYARIMVTLMLALMALVQTVQAAAAADASTVEKIENVKLTVEGAIALFLTLITAGIGVQLYRRLGKRATRMV